MVLHGTILHLCPSFQTVLQPWLRSTIMKSPKDGSTHVFAHSASDDDFTSTASRSTSRSHEAMERKEILCETPLDAIVADYDNISTVDREIFLIPPIAKRARYSETNIVDLTSNCEKDGPPPFLPNCLDDDDDCDDGGGGVNCGPQNMSRLPLSSVPETMSRPSLVHFFEPIEGHSRRMAVVKRPPSIHLKPSRTSCPKIIVDSPWADTENVF